MTSIVRAHQVTYRYPQNNYGLAPVSVSLRPGDLVHVAGPSGCGKSTLARCLTGLIPHLYRGQLGGDVWLNGLRTADTPLWQLAERAGLVFQNPAAQMLAVSVEEEIIFGLENLGLPSPVIHQRLQQILTRFDLEGLRRRSPQTLSGGEQQKLALAAITARQPPVLVLDEPLSMLDGTAAADLVAHLSQLSRSGTAIVVCEHRVEHLQAIPGLKTLYLNGTSPDEPSVPKVPFTPLPIPQIDPFQLDISNLGVELGGRPILQNLNLCLPGGQVVAVVGRNGVGKTTLLRALAGLQKHTGQVNVAGERPDLGLVFQNADLQLFNASVGDEVLYRLPDPDRPLYTQLLHLLGLTRYEQVPPLLLSEGEKKRVALATVLMRQPRHGLLLDEPALGQDEAHKSRLIQLARALADAGQLVVLTTHDLTLAAQADRLLLFGPQGLVADGPPAQVLRDEASWAALGLSVPDWVLASSLSENPAQAAVPGAWSISPTGCQARRELRRPGIVIRLGTSGRARKLALVEHSPLRRADPRTKLALSLCASLAVMLPLEKLALLMGIYVLLLSWARLLPMAANQVWRLKWVLIALFVLDWLLISLDLAVIICLRLILLAGSFAPFFATTTPRELNLALEWLRVPYRYAFSLSLAFQSIGLLDDEWLAIREAQRARGAWAPQSGWRNLLNQVRDLIALAVPAVVMSTKRAWAMTEAAYARGFDSPRRRPYRRLALKRLDWTLLAAAASISLGLLLCK